MDKLNYAEQVPLVADDSALGGNLSVSEFCQKNNVGRDEERRLKKLLGDFAPRHELIMNIQRKPNFR